MMRKVYFILLFFLIGVDNSFGQQNSIPHLQVKDSTVTLLVHDKPFIMLAGELGNSTATTTASMQDVWPKLQKLNLNTVLMPVYWELLEPEEGKFDLKLVDDLIKNARKYNLKIVFLWFGAWKNSMSSHAPAWVKTNSKRFPRVKDTHGNSQEILTPFSENNLNADAAAYKTLLKHIKDIDAANQTVILMQVENEIGILPSARDYSALANQQFNEELPTQLKEYLTKNKKNLHPGIFQIWKDNGFKTEGNWETVFGRSLQTDEIFMAYHLARYTDNVAAAGKEAYNLPTYVNAALNRPGVKPGDYPSAGPLPHVLDIWKSVSLNIDFYAPDFYNPLFKHWSDQYATNGNALFVPEHVFDDTVAAKALYAFGHYGALGFSPFAIEQTPLAALSPKEAKLSKTYSVLSEIKPLLDQNRGKGRIEGVLLDKEVKTTTFTLGNYLFEAEHTYNLGWEPGSKADDWESAAAIIIHAGPNEFYYVGFGISLKMKKLSKPDMKTGILKAERGNFKDGKWVVFQHLNGDQTHQGRHIRSFADDLCIQRFTLYEY